jgi:dsRNA-specific ribonuclease
MTDNLVLLNNLKMLGHDLVFLETIGKNHTETNKNFCCVIMVNGKVVGSTSGWSSKKGAKAAAAAAAVESLCLV